MNADRRRAADLNIALGARFGDLVRAEEDPETESGVVIHIGIRTMYPAAIRDFYKAHGLRQTIGRWYEVREGMTPEQVIQVIDAAHVMFNKGLFDTR